MNWHVHAGGTGAAEGHDGYTAPTPIGTYRIDPTTWPNGQHKGYIVTVTNDYGVLPEPGLWQWLTRGTVRYRDAKKVCEAHYNQHKGRAHANAEGRTL
jgi:hypothetical protein